MTRRRRGRRAALAGMLAAVGLLAQMPARATAGGLDWGFGYRGLATAGSRSPGRALDIALQRDGKILVSGSDDVRTSGDEGVFFGLARFDARGRLDKRFGRNGVARVYEPNADGSMPAVQGQDVTVDPHGRILVAAIDVGVIEVVRFMPNGSRDSTFGQDGVARWLVETSSQAIAIAVQPDSKPVVVGTRGLDPVVMRFTATGFPDATFGMGGIALLMGGSSLSNVGDILNDVSVLPDGRIVVVGAFGVGPLDADASGESYATNFMIARLTSSGLPDIDFGDLGVVVSDVDQFDSYERIVLLRDGKMLVVGSAVGGINLTSRIVLDRYNSDGTLDSSFGRGGRLIMSGGVLPRMAVQPDGKIVVIDEFTIRRLLTNGKIDRSLRFVRTPPGLDGLTDVAIHPNGRILTSVRWRRDFAVAAFRGR